MQDFLVGAGVIPAFARLAQESTARLYPESVSVPYAACGCLDAALAGLSNLAILARPEHKEGIMAALPSQELHSLIHPTGQVILKDNVSSPQHASKTSLDERTRVS